MPREHVAAMKSDWSEEAQARIAAAQQGWLRDQAESIGGGRKAIFETSSGRTVESRYTTALLPADFSYVYDLGFPGSAPYTRGERAAGNRDRLWSWEFYAGFGSAKDANERYRYLIELGSTGGVSIALDLPTQIGLDSDHPLAGREIGEVGVALRSLTDVLEMFEGIDLARAGKIFTTGNCIGLVSFAWFYCLAEALGEPLDSFVVTIQNDPLKESVARGTQFLPVPASVKLACDVVEFSASEGIPWYPISVSGSHMKQAGGTRTQEAADTLANAIAYADHLRDGGARVADVARVMELHFCPDMDFFEEIAKYRVVRRAWTEVLAERYGVTGVAPHVHAATSGLPLTAQQPRNNIGRITLQALAQILGGVHQTRTASYDESLAIPTEDAVKLSIQTNQIIAHETGIADTVDPLGGSYYLESLTRQMHSEVREILASVDRMGGAVTAVKSGYFARELAEGAYRQQVELESGRRTIVGVNAFADESNEPLKIFKVDPEAAAEQRERVLRHKAGRDAARVSEAMSRLHADLHSDTNTMSATIEAVRVGLTVGEIAQAWRDAYGEYHPEARWLA